jgi:hypothetical protein
LLSWQRASLTYKILFLLFIVFALLLTAWAAAALYFDFPLVSLRLPAAIAYIMGLLAVWWFRKKLARPLAIWIGSAFFIMGCWFLLRPSNHRHWQPDVAEMPWAESKGDIITIHNVRNCDYVTETQYTPHWETRTIDLSRLQGADLFLTHWGSPLIAHAIVSFRFTDGQYLALSIEARKEIGEDYSAVRGFFRQYELIYIVADERDVVRVRTNYRKGELVSLYRTMTTPQDSRNLLMQYFKWMNDLRKKPEWYNALTSNCTSGLTNYLVKAKVGGLSRWDWRIIFNGRGDEMLYQLGDLASDGLSFPELKQKALINGTAQAADSDPDFSRRIRQGRPGFEAESARQ